MIENCPINEYLYELYQNSDDVCWKDIAKIVNEKYNTNLSADACRKRVKRLQDTISVQDINLKKEDIKIADIRHFQNATIRYAAREETIKEIAHEFAQTMSSKFTLQPSPNTVESNFLIKKEAVLLIGDWHYGLSIDNWFNTYNPNIARLRVQQLQDDVIKILQKEEITKLTVLNLGDMISGSIHLPLRINSRIDVITQTMEVSEIIAQFLYHLSNRVVNLDYYSVLDNHSRLSQKKQESIQLESLARITHWYLKERMKTTTVEIHDNHIDEDIAMATVNGYNILAVHGDKDYQKNIVANLSTFTKQHYDIICSAHFHHFSANDDCDTLHISNGSLMGTDEYAFKVRKNSKPSQTLLIVTDTNPCEQIYRLILN